MQELRTGQGVWRKVSGLTTEFAVLRSENTANHWRGHDTRINLWSETEDPPECIKVIVILGKHFPSQITTKSVLWEQVPLCKSTSRFLKCGQPNLETNVVKQGKKKTTSFDTIKTPLPRRGKNKTFTSNVLIVPLLSFKRPSSCNELSKPSRRSAHQAWHPTPQFRPFHLRATEDTSLVSKPAHQSLERLHSVHWSSAERGLKSRSF